MKKITLLLLLALMALGAFAQTYPTVTIQQIQTKPADSLLACKQVSDYLGDTVITYGTVIMDARITPPSGGALVNNAQAAGGRNVWLQSGTGPFSGIDLFTTGVPTPVPGTDVLDLVTGDSVKVTGIVLEFGNAETEIVPLNIELLSSSRPVTPNFIPVSDLNDANRVNQLPTGERWEGVYIELRNVTVSEVLPFSGNTRVSFNVTDAAGNKVNVSDRFLVQRLPSNGGAFVAPTVGTIYDTLRGIIIHSPNGCLSTSNTNRGYELNPFKASDYKVQAGASAPLISGITRNPVTPTGSQDVNVFATIQDVDGTVTSAKIKYAVGVGTTTYLEAVMSNSGGTTWTGTIPNTAFSDGDFVKFYVTATDNDNLTANIPDVPSNVSSPIFFFVRDNGTTIYDVQFTPYTNGNSGYSGLEVTLEGIVTASAQPNDLGYVYIQQPGQTQWAGLSLIQNAGLASVLRGDRVRATGIISESFGFTVMTVNNLTVLNQGNALPPAVNVNPADFTVYSFVQGEPYESMVVTLKNPTAGKGIYVVDQNADDPSPFAEYRVGSNVFDPNSGCRVLAGRVTTSAFSSLSFSYVNDSIFEPVVPRC
ncbi:MAG: hypothetical protein EAZ89_00730, partial [Bacteroidetes bacterium]